MIDPAALIADHLQTGLVHPGDENHKPVLVPLPMFRTTAMPEELANHVKTLAKMLGQAIVHLLRTEGGLELIPTAELAELRNTVAPPSQASVITIECPHNVCLLEVAVPQRLRLNEAQINALTQGCELCTPASPSTTNFSSATLLSTGNSDSPMSSPQPSNPTP